MMATFTDSSSSDSKRPKLSNTANVLMVGTGEYTTGYVGGTAADSDKGSGVVALTMFDLRRREKVDRLGMCGVNVSGFKCIHRFCFGALSSESFIQLLLMLMPSIITGHEISRNTEPHAEEYW